MKGCAEPGSPVLLSRSTNQKRKLPFTLELIRINGHWVGINTMRPNHLVREAISQGTIPELSGYQDIRSEVRYGTNSRIDLLLSGPAGSCYVEVKNVTLLCGESALFPDAVTTRGQKHLRELMQVVQTGGRGVIFFVVQREDAQTFGTADSIDPNLWKTAEAGDSERGGGTCLSGTCRAPGNISDQTIAYYPMNKCRTGK